MGQLFLRDRLAAAGSARWRDHLADADARVRRTALLAGSRDAGDAELVAIVNEAVQDPTATVRREAAEVSGRRPAVAAAVRARLARMLLQDPEAHCREAAAFALGESGEPQAADDLMRALPEESSPLVRESIAAALGALGRPDTAGAVVELTSGEKPAVRRRAVVALAAFDAPEAHAAIEAAAADRDRFVREAAEWLLREEP